MKKIALLLCAVLTMSLLLYGCGKDEPAPEANSSAPGVSDEEMPTTAEEIVAHNKKIDPADIDFIQFKTPAAGAQTASIETSMGTVKVVLFPEEAPNAVNNFIELAKKGYYDGQKFYEVVPTVRVAGGSPDGGKSGESAGGDKFADEYSLNLWHFNGALAMNNGGIPDQNDSRFYFVTSSATISDELLDEMVAGGFPEKVVNKYLEVGGVPHYDFKDTVFGQVIEGMDVIQKIAAASRDENNKPNEDITIVAVDIGTL